MKNRPTAVAFSKPARDRPLQHLLHEEVTRGINYSFGVNGKGQSFSRGRIRQAVVCCLLWSVGNLSAAVITWTAQGTFSNNTVLALAGPPAAEVYGLNFNGGTFTTASGYSFGPTGVNFTVLSGNFAGYTSYLSGGGSTGDTNFDSILNTGIYLTTLTPPGTGTLNNLTPGVTYNVLTLSADTRPTSAGFTLSVNGSTPQQVYAFSGGTPALGGYLLGQFTADATTQRFDQSVWIPQQDSQYQAILVTIVPEPSVVILGLMGLGLVAVTLRRRLKRKICDQEPQEFRQMPLRVFQPDEFLAAMKG